MMISLVKCIIFTAAILTSVDRTKGVPGDFSRKHQSGQKGGDTGRQQYNDNQWPTAYPGRRHYPKGRQQRC